MSNNNIFISVVIPCYNEENNLEKQVLGKVRKFLEDQNYTWEVIVSDDQSSDNSRKMVTEQIKNWKNFRLLENKHGGKWAALWEGIKVARGKFILFADMDQSTPISELPKLLKFTNQYKAVIGSRGLSRKNFPFYRKVGAIVFMSFRKFFLLPEIDDTQCGFKLFDKDILKKAFPKIELFRETGKVVGWKVSSYDVELLHVIKKIGFKIKEVTVEWKDEDDSVSKGGALSRYVKESKEMLLQITRVKLNDIRGYYSKEV